MKKSYKEGSLKWSNLFFLLPLFIAAAYNLYWYAVVLLVVFVVSLDFHFFNEAKEVFYLDVIFSCILMFSNFVLLFIAAWALPYSAAAVACALIAFIFYFKKNKGDYYLNHSLWHVFSAGVCLFCLMSLLSVS